MLDRFIVAKARVGATYNDQKSFSFLSAYCNEYVVAQEYYCNLTKVQLKNSWITKTKSIKTTNIKNVGIAKTTNIKHMKAF